MNELSPRRVPRSPMAPPKTPPNWRRPEEVMRRHRLRAKTLASQNRLNQSSISHLSSDVTTSNTSGPPNKRKNPFRCGETISQEAKKPKEEDDQNSSILRLLGLTDPQLDTTDYVDVNDILMKIKAQNEEKITSEGLVGCKNLSVDWSLRLKIRFMATKPFPWTQTLKTCEEASGITGFVRCVTGGCGSWRGLDTSPNAIFHQYCCYWQHPSLPWLPLFPRSIPKQSEVSKLPTLGTHPKIKEALHRDWTDSFRSLFQLVRTRHCPFFYMVANTFTCVFRAVGLSGCGETNVMLSPTSIGFRQMLKNEGIQFKMPLKKKESQVRSPQEEAVEEDEALDEMEDLEDEADGETREWLSSLGVEEDEINRISSTQEQLELTKKRKCDGDYDSLVLIEGSEAQAFFNFIINCKSITPVTGPLSGIPPTLIAPVAFVGSALSTLKVRESIVKVDNENYYSMEVRGPILPHTVQNLCHILRDHLDKYSVTFATIDSTKAYSMASKVDGNSISSAKEESKETSITGHAFSQESLSDCGLQQHVLAQFCSKDVQIYDSIKFSDSLFSVT